MTQSPTDAGTGHTPPVDPFRNRSAFLGSYVEAAEAALAIPFQGITTRGQAQPGLFTIKPTGVSTEPIRAAAHAYLTDLTAEQTARAVFPVTGDAWQRWSNIHPPLLRHGVCMMDMTDSQRERAMDVLRASLSTAGFHSARDVMRLNETVAEMTGRHDEYGDQRYWLSIMGTPSPDQPWGWQIDGHHLIINCFVLGDQVVLTPTFMGTEPVYAESGKYAGTLAFQAEESVALALMRSLDPDRRAKALLSDEQPHDVLATAFRDNLELGYQGICYDELSGAQRTQLEGLLAVYVGRLREGHAEAHMDEVRRHLNETHFAWIGDTGRDDVFYYRIHSPVILVEFDHQRGVAFRPVPVSRNHVHTVVRTPNGNDYGKDLLRQHLERHPH